MVNKAILLGRLGRDPELKQTKSGTPVCTLSLATDHSVKKGDEWEKATEWHQVTVWGKTAQNVAKYCQKGKQLYVEGRIQTEKYEKNGETRYSTKVVAELVKFVGGKSDAATAGVNHHAADAGSRNPSAQGAYGGSYSDDQIPF